METILFMHGPKHDISIARLQHALKLCARIVVLHGEVYLPIFERLEKDIKALEKRKITMERIKDILRV